MLKGHKMPNAIAFTSERVAIDHKGFGVPLRPDHDWIAFAGEYYDEGRMCEMELDAYSRALGNVDAQTDASVFLMMGLQCHQCLLAIGGKSVATQLGTYSLG